MPAFWSLFQIRSFRSTPEPFVEFYRHRRKEVPLVHSIQQVLTESTAADISGRPDPDSRHDLADGVDDLRRDALRFCRARLGLFEAGIKLSQGLLGSLRFAAASRRHHVRSTVLTLFRGCHVGMLAETGTR
jgi:hypothetical protein